MEIVVREDGQNLPGAGLMHPTKEDALFLFFIVLILKELVDVLYDCDVVCLLVNLTLRELENL